MLLDMHNLLFHTHLPFPCLNLDSLTTPQPLTPSCPDSGRALGRTQSVARKDILHYFGTPQQQQHFASTSRPGSTTPTAQSAVTSPVLTARDARDRALALGVRDAECQSVMTGAQVEELVQAASRAR